MQGLKLQETLLLEHVEKQLQDDDFSHEYQRSLDIALIKFMEGELDLGTHGTKAELRALDDKVFTLYFAKVKSAHSKLWVAEKMRQNPTIANGEVKNSLATFQASGRERFEKDKVNGTQANGVK